MRSPALTEFTIKFMKFVSKQKLYLLSFSFYFSCIVPQYYGIKLISLSMDSSSCLFNNQGKSKNKESFPDRIQWHLQSLWSKATLHGKKEPKKWLALLRPFGKPRDTLHKVSRTFFFISVRFAYLQIPDEQSLGTGRDWSPEIYLKALTCLISRQCWPHLFTFIIIL